MLGSFFNFDKFIAPVLIKIVYWIGIVGLVLAMLISMAGAVGAMQYSPATGMGTILIAVIGTAVGLLFWRVMCEVWIVMFSINDRLGQLVDRGKV